MEENTDMALIGLLIKKPDLLDHCQVLANFENPFINSRLNIIFRNIQSLLNETGRVERSALIKKGLPDGIQIDFYRSLSAASGFDVNIHEYVKGVHNSLIKRKITALGHSVINCNEDTLNDGSDYLKVCRDTIEEIEKHSCVSTGVSIDEAIQEVTDKAEALAEGRKGFYYKTGIFGIDQVIVGLTTKTMSVMAARPSIGKTAFGLTVMSNMTQQGTACGFISVEMSEAECIERIAQVRSNVSIYDFAHNLDPDSQARFYGSLSDISKCPYTQITRTTNRKISNIRSIARKMKNNNPDLKIIFIDYLQKILSDDPRQDKKTQIDMVSAILTDMATDLDVHICCMCQLNRDGDDAPKLKHLKDSGSIEQDAHYAFLIHRDLSKQHAGEYDGDAFIGIAKNRSGKTGNVALKYDGRTTRFYDDVTEEAF